MAVISQHIYFLKSKEISSDMNRAFASLNRDLFKPSWIDFNDLERLIHQAPGSVLIIDSSEETKEVENILIMCSKFLPIKIFTALAFLSINPNEIKHLPLSKCPISSTCMVNYNVTISGLAPRKNEQISTLLLRMGAQLKRCLHESISCIIADNWTRDVVSFLRKRRNALSVVRPEWVEKCWEMRAHLKDAREIVEQFKLPMFQGMRFAVTGFDSNMRTKISRFVKHNGGTYSKGLHLPAYKFIGGTSSDFGSLNPPYTTHLIVAAKNGPKYEAAMHLDDPRHKINIINLNWLRFSKKYSYPQSEIDPKYCARDH